MPQYACLELYRGTWHLLTDNPEEPAREWADQEVALADLCEEGWTVIELCLKQPRVRRRTRRRFREYGLMRTVN